uniref:Uncharacterized protein n=1 Tax=Rhizophora mucronata TaxID=61149 RepID=A0A2P2PE84_RHIMU
MRFIPAQLSSSLWNSSNFNGVLPNKQIQTHCYMSMGKNKNRVKRRNQDHKMPILQVLSVIITSDHTGKK